MRQQQWNCVGFLGKQGSEVNVESVTGVLDLHGEIGVAVDASFRLPPVVLRFPVLFGVAQPFTRDAPGRVVLDIARQVLERLGSDFGEFQQLLEVIQLLVGNVSLEWFGLERSFGRDGIPRHDWREKNI